MENENNKIRQNSLRNNYYKKNNDSNIKKQLNYSFSKEFINAIIEDECEEENSQSNNLAKSHLNLGDIIKMQEEILGESKEILLTILDEKIKKNNIKIKRFVNHNDINFNDIEQNSATENDNFLKLREIPEISKEDFNKIKYNLLDDKYLEDLKNFILNFKFPINSSNTTLAIGSLFRLEKLVESGFNNDCDFADEMITKYNLYQKYIFNYRTIKGDGNCYYRAVMFRYFEIIILNKEIDVLHNIILDMKNSFYSNEIMARKEIKMNTVFKPELPLKIMLIILDLIQKDNIELAHLIFLKSLLICPIFDYGLIFYFRYIFYIYIKDNENKLYLKNFPIKIGNLLPSKYETEEGDFLFNSFYQNYLLKMFMDAEKIIIYLTPFILGINLDIMTFEDDSEIIKNINYDGKVKYLFEDKIFLMNRRNHYELIYTQKENIKYEQIFNKYINNDFIKESTILYELNKNNNHEFINNNKINNIYNTTFPNDINFQNNNNTSENNIKKNVIKKKIKKKYKVKKKCKKPSFDNKGNNLVISNINQLENNVKEINTIDNDNEYNIHYNTIEISSNNGFNNMNNNNKNSIIENNEEKNNAIILNFPDNKKKSNKLIKKTHKIISNNRIIKDNNSIKKKPIITEENKNDKIIFKSVIDEISKINIINTLDNANKTTIKKKKIKKKIKNGENEINNNGIVNNLNNYKIKSSSTGKRIISNSINQMIINTDINNDKVNSEMKTKIKSQKQKNILIIKCECAKCTKIYTKKQNNDKNFNLCYECAKEEIINKFTDKYLCYIKGCLENEYKDELIAKKYNELLKSKIIINYININIEDSINQLSEYNNESFNIIYNDIIKQIKQSICLICCHKIEINQEDKIEIPCGCIFCNCKHLQFYFEEKKSISKGKEFVCYCSYKYNLKDIYNLGLKSYILPNSNLRKTVIEYFNNILKSQCSICENKEELKNIRYKDDKKSEENNEILAGYKLLKHFLCRNCIENKKDKDRFFCKICNKEHIFKK